jgi:DNA adenine methylase
MERFLKPILKWAGGKRWLVPILQELYEPYRQTQARLVEPFTGGMAIALGLNPQSALLNDANPYLINFYQQIQKGLKVNVDFENSSICYYELRERFNSLIQRKKHRNKEAASIFYFLIRTGYNGLCRFNSKGEFNVPFGQHKSIRYKADFLEYKPILKNWNLLQGDFENMPVKKGDFLYADPPYDVQFTKYHKDDFNWQDQERLAKWLVKHPGPVIASNQATDRILQLYQKFNFKVLTLSAPRSIACNGNRNPATEILAIKGMKPKLVKDLAKKIANIQ